VQRQGEHRQQIRLARHDKHGTDFGGKVQDQDILVVRAIVYRTGRVGQQPSPATLSCRRALEAAARCELAAEFVEDLRGIDTQIRGTRKKLAAAV
jgi:hypothetical protein